MEIAAAVLSIIALILPAVIRWIDKEMEAPDELDVLSKTHSRETRDLADALQNGTGVDVAAAWARHDRLLLDAGLSRPGTRDSHRRRVGYHRKSRRDVYRDRRVDVETSGDGAVTPQRAGEVRAGGRVIPIFK